MYKTIAAEDLAGLRDLGFMKMTQDLTQANCNGFVDIVNKDNPKNCKHIFKFWYSYTEHGLIFSDIVPVYHMESQREYEKFLILALEKMLDIGKEFSMPKLLVQSEEPRILEGCYETNFDEIKIINITKFKNVYSGVKYFRKKEIHENR